MSKVISFVFLLSVLSAYASDNIDANSNAKLKVTFLKIYKWLYLIWGDYWILDLDSNYRWVIVGAQSHKYGWILARDSILSKADLLMLSEKLKQQGFDTCKFMTARQKGGSLLRIPLCQVVGH